MGSVEGSKGAREKNTNISMHKKVTLNRAKMLNELSQVEAEYKKLRASYDRTNPGRDQDLVELGNRVGDLHRTLRQPTADLVAAEKAKAALYLEIWKLLRDPEFKEQMRKLEIMSWSNLKVIIERDKAIQLLLASKDPPK